MRILLLLLIFSPCLLRAQESIDSLAKPTRDLWYMGLGIGTSIDKTTEDEAHSASAQAVAGWNFHEWGGVGAGLGIHDAYFNWEQFQFMPLFMQLIGRTPGKIGVVGFVNTGYTFALRKDEEEQFFRREYEGGWHWHTGGGFRFRVKEADLQVNIAYRTFESTIRGINIWEGEETFISEEKRRFNRVEIMLALEI